MDLKKRGGEVVVLGMVTGHLVVGLWAKRKLVGLWKWVGLGVRFVDLRMQLKILALGYGFLFLAAWHEERKLVF